MKNPRSSFPDGPPILNFLLSGPGNNLEHSLTHSNRLALVSESRRKNNISGSLPGHFENLLVLHIHQKYVVHTSSEQVHSESLFSRKCSFDRDVCPAGRIFRRHVHLLLPQRCLDRGLRLRLRRYRPRTNRKPVRLKPGSRLVLYDLSTDFYCSSPQEQLRR
jgi:hypothetical protein